MNIEHDFNDFTGIPLAAVLVENIDVSVLSQPRNVKHGPVRVLLLGNREVAGAENVEVLRLVPEHPDELLLEVRALFYLRILLIKRRPISRSQRALDFLEGADRIAVGM